MSLRGVTIKEGKIGANVIGDGREFGMIGIGYSSLNGFSPDKIYTLTRLSDAEALGITPYEYDSHHFLQWHHHISEFFRCSGEVQQ